MNPTLPPTLNSPVPSTRRPSDSLVGSLCWEVDGLRRRASQVLEGIGRCHDGPLLERLRRELASLQGRHRELQRTARSLAVSTPRDSLSVALLLELTRRPLAH